MYVMFKIHEFHACTFFSITLQFPNLRFERENLGFSALQINYLSHPEVIADRFDSLTFVLRLAFILKENAKFSVSNHTFGSSTAIVTCANTVALEAG